MTASSCRPGSCTASSTARDDLEILEIYSPAVHETVVVDRIREAGAAR